MERTFGDGMHGILTIPCSLIHHDRDLDEEAMLIRRHGLIGRRATAYVSLVFLFFQE
jgi:hypothetical protein